MSTGEHAIQRTSLSRGRSYDHEPLGRPAQLSVQTTSRRWLGRTYGRQEDFHKPTSLPI